MRYKQSINLLLIALFVWAFQSTTVHYSHHQIEGISECSVCDTAEHLDLQHHHNTPVIVFNEHLAIKSGKSEAKVETRSRFVYLDIPLPNKVPLFKLRDNVAGLTPLGFYATAPPVLG